MKTGLILIVAGVALPSVSSSFGQASGVPRSYCESIAPWPSVVGAPGLCPIPEKKGTHSESSSYSSFDYDSSWYWTPPPMPSTANTSSSSTGSGTPTNRRPELTVEVLGRLPEGHDPRILDAIRKRWRELSQESPFLPRSGFVILEFRFGADGRVTELTEKRNDVGVLLGLVCQRAVWEADIYRKRPTKSTPRPVVDASPWTIRFNL